MYAFMGMCNWVYRWYRPGGMIMPEAIIETFSRILESGCLRSPEDTRDVPVPERLQQLEEHVSEIKEELKQVARHLRLNNGW